MFSCKREAEKRSQVIGLAVIDGSGIHVTATVIKCRIGELYGFGNGWAVEPFNYGWSHGS